MNIDQQPLLVIHQPSELPNRKAYPLSRCKVCVTKGISPGTGGLSTLGDPAIHKAPSGEPHELVIHHEISRFLDPWIHHSSKPSWIALYKPVCVVQELTYLHDWTCKTVHSTLCWFRLRWVAVHYDALQDVTRPTLQLQTLHDIQVHLRRLSKRFGQICLDQ